MVTHVLDTSAWIAHLQHEAGADVVAAILAAPENQVGVSALSLVELHARLRALGREAEFEPVVEGYRLLFAAILSVDEQVALQATLLRRDASKRVPAIDALIAATAASQNAILVHRDPHFRTIPGDQLQQLSI